MNLGKVDAQETVLTPAHRQRVCACGWGWLRTTISCSTCFFDDSIAHNGSATAVHSLEALEFISFPTFVLRREQPQKFFDVLLHLYLDRPKAVEAHLPNRIVHGGNKTSLRRKSRDAQATSNQPRVCILRQHTGP